MLFNSLTFLLFLFCTVTLYWSFSQKFRLVLIFFSSLLFYSFWKIEFLPILLLSTFVDWFISRKMNKSSYQKRKILLLISLIFNLSLLFYFKYLIFFANSFIELANYFGLSYDPIIKNIILPLGISFYTFQTISYTIDVYRKTIKPEKNFIIYACYVTFFPQLVAGPVLRAAEVIKQFKIEKKFNLNLLLFGFRRILYGLFLKTVLADNIASFVDHGFAMPLNSISAIDVWTLAFLFGFQIYFDFSAYSHIAIGSAKMIGLNFPENFNFPYFSASPREFWKKWHISLSSWIRDYLYLPLKGEKFQNNSTGGVNLSKNDKNLKPLFFSWTIMGLWHGANWTFLIWGFYHFILIVIYRSIIKFKKIIPLKLLKSFGVLVTLPFIMLGWIPFRAENLDSVFYMWVKVFMPMNYTWLGMRENVYLITFLILAGHFLTFIFSIKITLNKYYIYFLDAIMISIVTVSTFISFRTVNQFIYFQF